MTDPGTAVQPADGAAVRQLAALLAGAERVFVLSGAGMSTESGIDDFRGPNGLWTRNPAAARMFDIDAYRSDREVRTAAWEHRARSPIRSAAPNVGHRVLARWQDDRAVTIATQNIDGLHQRAGSAEVLELHGSFWQAQCLDCGEHSPIEAVFGRLDAGEEDPACLRCGGILRTATVAFGQALDPAVLGGAVRAARASVVALAIGTSLTVQPAASLCGVAAADGASVVIINEQPTDYDSMADLVIHAGIGATLAAVDALLLNDS